MSRVRPADGSQPPHAGAAGGSPLPGWYPDPGGAHQFRYWNGWAWTPGVADGGQVTEDWPGALAGRDGAAAPPAAGEPGADTRAQLPRRAGLLAISGIAGSLLLAMAGSLVAAIVAPHSPLANLVLSQAGLWAGLVGAVVLASRRFGSGDVWRDFGVRAERMDVWRGFVTSVVGRVTGLMVVLPLVALDRRLAGSDLQPFKGARGNPLLFGVLIIIALVGAPFVEELFFRGLLLRSLIPIAGTAGAIGLQAVVFGLAHLRPSYGLGNVSVFAAIALMGVVQGFVAERYRRLGPAMFSHAFFNLGAVLAIGIR